MKNDLFKKNILTNIFKILIWSLLTPYLLFILFFLLQKMDFQWLFEYSNNLYYILKSLFQDDIFMYMVIYIIWLIGIIYIIYKLIKKNHLLFNDVLKSIEEIKDKNIDYVYLPEELEELEKKLNHLKKEIEKSEKLAQENEKKKNDLIVYLAHDLKTPLTSLIGYLSLLNEASDLPKKQREKYLKIVLDKSYKLEELINELFDITRFNTENIILEKSPVNLNMMLEQIIDDFYPLLKENNKKIKLHGPSKIIVQIDSNKMARVFNNIIKNAINYSTGDLITIDVLKKDNKITIITTNQGKKIEKEQLEKMFEQFYRLDLSRNSKTGGSGLGLAISKEIVELHGGKIKATSDSKYTKIYVTIPI